MKKKMNGKEKMSLAFLPKPEFNSYKSSHTFNHLLCVRPGFQAMRVELWANSYFISWVGELGRGGKEFTHSYTQTRTCTEPKKNRK